MGKNKKRTMILSLAILLVGAIAILVSYSLWQVTEKQTNRNLVGSACLSMTYSNETNDIELASTWPMADEKGKATTPYSFTITNNCDMAVNYQISLESVANPDNPNIANDYYISDQYIKVYLDDDVLATYDFLPDVTIDSEANYKIRSNKKILTGKLFAHEAETHELRLWIDSETPMSQMNKGFYSKIEVIGGQGVELDCYFVDEDGVLTRYNSDCGISATIPATVNGIPVRKIASDAFKDGDKYHYDLNSGTTYDDLDFSVLANPAIVSAINENDYATLAGATTDDFKIIVYDEDDKKINDAIDYLKQNPDSYISSLYQLESISSVRVDDIPIVKYSRLPANPVGSEFFYKTENVNNNHISSYVGYRASENVVDSKRYAIINFLDLSKATNLEEIDDNAFSYVAMDGMTLRMPSSLRRIGKSAFVDSRCNVILNEGLQVIDDYAFIENWYTMTSIEIPRSVTTLGERIFNYSDLTVTVHNQELYDNRNYWGYGLTVVYEP